MTAVPAVPPPRRPPVDPMTGPAPLPAGGRLTVRERCGARAAVAVARVLAALPPHRMCRLLERIRRGARPATAAEALRARHAVVTVSPHCAGDGCLPRSLATALLCRARGHWPQWCSGVRTAPFRTHAWVAVDGRPVGEPAETAFYHRVLSVP
ncbi:lasso peptide biosynthesis B2 protein [Streptomyces lydicus]|nr:lasso peptide biosynthesis B2 protein [Streptomyces lydicus]